MSMGEIFKEIKFKNFQLFKPSLGDLWIFYQPVSVFS